MTIPLSNEPDTSAPNDRQPATVTDVRISWAANRAAMLATVGCVVAVVLLGFALTWGTSTATAVRKHPLVFGLVFFLAMYPLTKLGLRVARTRILASTREIITQGKENSVSDLVETLFGQRGRVFQATYLEAMVRVLAEQGHVGVTIRSGPPVFATTIDPITVAFEPRMLDETDAATLELQDSLDSTAAGSAAPAPQGSFVDRLTGRRVKLTGRRVKRNFRMAGGWVAFVAFTFHFIAAVVDSIQRWVVTAQLVMWGLVWGTLIFGVSRSRLSGGRAQWFAVPGGILVRKTRLREPDWSLHLFDRRTSALVVQWLRRDAYYVCVADGKSHQSGFAAPREVVFLLQAWLSPLHPPPVEKLSDLA